MIVANNNISFWSKGVQVNYKKGDDIRPEHTNYVKTHFSGRVIEDHMFRIKSATININSNDKSVVESLSEMKKSIETANNTISELRDIITGFKIVDDVPHVDKQTHVKLTVDSVSMIPENDIEVEGSAGDEITTGPEINVRVGQLRRVMERKND